MRKVPKSITPKVVEVAWVVRTGGSAWTRDVFFTWDKSFGEQYVRDMGGDERGYWLAVAFFCAEDEIETHQYSHLTNMKSSV